MAQGQDSQLLCPPFDTTGHPVEQERDTLFVADTFRICGVGIQAGQVVEAVVDVERALHLDFKTGQRMLIFFAFDVLIDLVYSAVTRLCFARCPISTLTKSPVHTVLPRPSLFLSSRRITFRSLKALRTICTISRAMKRTGKLGWRRSSSLAFVIHHSFLVFILMAISQSYVLHQEKQVLFQGKGAGTSGGPSTNGSGGISRSATIARKSPGAANRPLQPLVAMSDNAVFEPGSLLGSRHL